MENSEFNENNVDVVMGTNSDGENSDYAAHSDLETSSYRSSTRDSFDDDDPNFHRDSEEIVNSFRKWNPSLQLRYVQKLLKSMNHSQVGKVNNFLRPMLMRDFISDLYYTDHISIAQKILGHLDADSLKSASRVCATWHKVIFEGTVFMQLIEEHVNNSACWFGIVKKANLLRYLRCSPQFAESNELYPDFEPNAYYKKGKNLFETEQQLKFMPTEFYISMYNYIVKEIKRLEDNWREGRCNVNQIVCNSESSKGVYCLQYDEHKIVCGLRDNTIKIFDLQTLCCTKSLWGHTGSVLCLQYDKHVIISGSSDTTVRVWMMDSYECVNVVYQHVEAVLHLRFAKGTLVTCSKDRSISVWQMTSPKTISLKRVLMGHKAAVNVVDFDSKYIVSASGDRTIKVWSTQTYEPVRTLTGHKRGIACLQYRDKIIVSGSSDNTIRLWYIECGSCIRILEGHLELVRCIRFSERYIVSGSYDGEIKVWDLQAALNPRLSVQRLCIKTLNRHKGRVFRLQFDDFKIISSSHDDSILIWDFFDVDPSLEKPEEQGGANDGIYVTANGDKTEPNEKEHFKALQQKFDPP